MCFGLEHQITKTLLADGFDMPDGVIEAARDGLKRFWSEGGAGVQAVEYLLGPILWDATRVEVYQKEP